MSNERAAAGLAAFLNHSLDGGGGEWIGNWKDNGSLTVWLHPDGDLANASCFTHPFFNVREYEARGDEPAEVKVRWHKFNCCDPDRTAGASRWYEPDGWRQNPPVVCPIDFLLEWASVEIVAGRLDWKTPIFEFRGDDPKGDRLIRAGGMLGLFNRDDNSKEQQQELRRAGIDRSMAYQQDLRSRGGYVLAVVDDAVRDCVQKWSIQGTGNPLKSLPGMFKAAIQKVQKGYRVDDPSTGRSVDVPPANPLERPYRFNYFPPPKDPKTGKPKGFGEYSVTPLNRAPDAKVRELFAMPCPDLAKDREKGNCLELRMIMEQHCVYKPLPLDSFFEKADRAGLMKPRDEKPKKPRSTQEGRVPEVRALNTEAATASSVQAPTVECLSCGRGMPADDLTCTACGATYDEGGDLDGIPCLTCKTVVPVDDQAGRFICPKCAALHTLGYVEDGKRAAGRRPVWQLALDEDQTSDGEDLPGDGEGDDLPY